MARRQTCDKLLPGSMLTYCQWGPKEQSSMKLDIQIFSFTKNAFQNV